MIDIALPDTTWETWFATLARLGEGNKPWPLDRDC